MRPVTILAVGLVASGTTATLVYRAVQHRVVVKTVTTNTNANVAVKPVVVAAEEVPFGAKLEEGHLKVVDWPMGALPPNAFESRDKVAGRVALARLVPNEPITNEKLAPAEGHGLLSMVVEPGMRAVTVRVNEVAAVGGFIVPGTRVDVLVTAELKNPPQLQGTAATGVAPTLPSERHTRTVLQNVSVLALGQVVEPAGGQPKPGEAQALTTATLLVTPEQGELLALGAAEGQLQLVLRNFEDNQIVRSPGKAAHDLFENGNGGNPETFAANRVEVIRGAQRLEVSF
jgi:pilus assembly protein CpaB